MFRGVGKRFGERLIQLLAIVSWLIRVLRVKVAMVDFPVTYI